MSTHKIYDAIVVGLGGVGSFALRSLSRSRTGNGNGNKVTRTFDGIGTTCNSSGIFDGVAREGLECGSNEHENENTNANANGLGLERFQIGHDMGSSHGSSRLFRSAYFEHPNYVPLCLRSTKIFQELSDWKLSSMVDANKEENSDFTPLLERCGVLVVSDGGKNGKYEIIEKCANAAEEFKIPIERMNDSTQIRERYGHSFHISNHMQALLEPGAGFVRPELAVRYAIDDALHHGAHIVENTVVTNISTVRVEGNNSTDSNVLHVVDTADGKSYRARGVVVTAGPWASKLLPELDRHLTVTRQIQAWFKPRHPSTSPSTGWYLDRAKDEIPIYGIPADPLCSKHPDLVKIALHGRDVPFDPDDDRPPVTEDEMQELFKAAEDWIPSASGRFVASKACLYTMTPDENFIVDRCHLNIVDNQMASRSSSNQRIRRNVSRVLEEDDDDDSNVWCVAGLSGHGFKMTPALGEAVADLVLKGETDLPIEFLRKKRLIRYDDAIGK
jgi:sarcosine oxidase